MKRQGLGAALGGAAGLAVTFLAFILLRPPLLLLLVPIATGIALGGAVQRSKLPRVVLVLGPIASYPVVYGLQIGHLQLLAAGIPRPPGATRTGGKAASGDFMAAGPFAQVDLRTTLEFDAVVAFYDSTLTAGGWTRHHCFTLDEFSFYTYRRAAHKILLQIWQTTDAADHSRRVQTTYYFPAGREALEASPESCAPVQTIRL